MDILNGLKKNSFYEPINYNERMPSIANTYQPTNDLDKSIIRSTNYARIGQAKYEDPFPNNQRFLNWYENGRNLYLLNSLKDNKKRDYPDVITINPLKVSGYY